jgi:hypothetical protein
MRILFVAVLAVLLAGCGKTESTSQPAKRLSGPIIPKLAAAVEVANHRYEAISYSMKRADVYRALGQPNSTNAEGVIEWRTSEGEQAARISMKFQPDGTMTQRELQVLYANPAMATNIPAK